MKHFDKKSQISHALVGFSYQRQAFTAIVLSATVIGDNLLPIIAIAQNSFHLSITDIALVIS